MILNMRVTSGKVISGQIRIEGEALPDGALVTVLSREGDETFELDADAENELLGSIRQIERGKWVPGDELLARLRSNS